MTSINDLPNEILLQIFQNVPNKKELTLTCRRWNDLIGPMLHLRIKLYYSSIVDKLFKTEFLRPYQHLTIYGVMNMQPMHPEDDLSDSSEESLPTQSARRETDHCELVRKCLEVTRQLEPHLTELSLWFGPLADKIVTAFLPRGPSPCRLGTLHIGFTSGYLEEQDVCTVNQVVALVAKDDQAEVVEMPNLREFHYDDRRSNVDRTIRRKLFNTIVRKAKGVTEISLQCLFCPCFPDFRIMRSFAKQLLHVSCVIWPIFTQDFFQLTFPRAESMYLSFDSCRSLPDTAANFFANAVCLKDLAVEKVHTSEFFWHCVSKCSQLEKLTINDDREIPIDAIQNLCRFKELNLTCSDSDHAIEQSVVPRSQTLEKLALERSTVGLAFYSMLATNIPFLVELYIAEDRKFNDWCLQSICSSMVNLRRLKLALIYYVDDQVTERGFQNIDRLGKLEYLYLESFDSDVFPIRRVPFAYIFTDWVQKVPAPQIHLKDFRKFNLHTIWNFLLNPNLKELILDGCGDVSCIEEDNCLKDDLKKLKQLKHDIPNVRIIN